MPFPRLPIKPAETSPWVLLLVPLYSFLLRPALLTTFPVFRVWNIWVLLGTMILMLLVLFYTNRISSFGNALQPTHAGPHLLLGLCAGALISLFPLLLDQLIIATPLSQEPLFKGADLRALEQPPISLLTLVEIFVLKPFLGQIILIGFLMSPAAGRLRQLSFVILATLMFPVFFWQFSLGLALVGTISGLMYRFTGTLYAGIGFQALCGLAGVLVVYVAPRTITMFGVLF